MVSWSSIQSLVLFVGPLLLPRIISTYRNIRAQAQSRPQRIRPLPRHTSVALGILFASALLAFLSTLPLFSPDNIFRLTSSRIVTSTAVIFTRLAALRPLTPHDTALRSVFESSGLEARLLYAQYGPGVLADNIYTTPGAPGFERIYFLYALPAILLPHLAHLVALGVATSATWCGRDGARWRTWAVIMAMSLATIEIWIVATYDSRANAKSQGLHDVDFVFWKRRVTRGLAVALVDAGLGWAIWLQTTGRAFWGAVENSAAERVGEQGRALEQLLSRLRTMGVLMNTVVRDVDARSQMEKYWTREAEVMREVFERPTVLEAQRNALGRLDMRRVEREAQAYAENVVGRPDVARS